MSERAAEGFSAEFPEVKVLFGVGRRKEVGEAVASLGACKAFVLTTQQQEGLADEMAGLLGERYSGRYTNATMHSPVEVTEEAMGVLQGSGADCLVAVGGGSTVGLSKALALRTGLPQVAVPTTYAGSESTPILGQTEKGVKSTMKDRGIQPRTVVYDPELTVSLPVGISVNSAINAIAHAIEAMYASDRNPLSTVVAIEGVRAFRESLPGIMESPDDLAFRGRALYGAWLCGTVLGQVGMALHHKLCHALGGTFDLPHAETHAIVLPYAVAYNEDAAREELAPIADMFGGANPSEGIRAFCEGVGAPTALRDLGMPESGIGEAVRVATLRPYWNPREVEAGQLERLVRAAWAGEPPGSLRH